MKRIILPSLLFLALAAQASVWGHDLKILTNRPSLPDVDGKVTVYLSWGHRLPVDELVDGSTLERYDIIAPAGKATALPKEGTSLHAHVAELKENGVHSVVAGRKSSIHTYVIDDDGQKKFKRGPKSAHVGAKIDSAVRSTQSARAIVVVGSPGDEAPKATGLHVEIVPMDGPARWKANGELRLKVLHRGQPLAGATIEARSLSFDDDAPRMKAETNSQGEVTLRPKQAGVWIVKSTHKTPAAEASRTEYDVESLTTTLSLEVRP